MTDVCKQSSNLSKLLPGSPEVAPNAGALAPKAGLLAAPKAGLLLGAPNGELEAPKAGLAPKALPAGDAAPVLPLQPSCKGLGRGERLGLSSCHVRSATL